MENLSQSIHESTEASSVLDYQNLLYAAIDEIESVTSGAFWLMEGKEVNKHTLAKVLTLLHMASERAAEAKELLGELHETHKREVKDACRRKEV